MVAAALMAYTLAEELIARSAIEHVDRLRWAFPTLGLTRDQARLRSFAPRRGPHRSRAWPETAKLCLDTDPPLSLGTLAPGDDR